jgi:hypothetical protein
MVRIACVVLGLWLCAACVQADESLPPAPVQRGATVSTNSAKDLIHRRAAREAAARRARIEQRKRGGASNRAPIGFMYPNWYDYRAVPQTIYPWWQR